VHRWLTGPAANAPSRRPGEVARRGPRFQPGILALAAACSRTRRVRTRARCSLYSAGARCAVRRRGVQPVGGQHGGLIIRRASIKESLHGNGAHWRSGHGDQSDAPSSSGALGGGADERPVEKPAAELEVGAPARGDREDHLGNELVVLERGGEAAEEERIRWDAAPGGDDLRDGRQGHGDWATRANPVPAGEGAGPAGRRVEQVQAKPLAELIENRPPPNVRTSLWS
jgi:hypothetical protein